MIIAQLPSHINICFSTTLHGSVIACQHQLMLHSQSPKAHGKRNLSLQALQTHAGSDFRWDQVLQLCRFLKDRTLWACLAALAVKVQQLDKAEAAFAAIDQARCLPACPARHCCQTVFVAPVLQCRPFVVSQWPLLI